MDHCYFWFPLCCSYTPCVLDAFFLIKRIIYQKKEDINFFFLSDINIFFYWGNKLLEWRRCKQLIPKRNIRPKSWTTNPHISKDGRIPMRETSREGNVRNKMYKLSGIMLEEGKSKKLKEVVDHILSISMLQKSRISWTRQERKTADEFGGSQMRFKSIDLIVLSGQSAVVLQPCLPHILMYMSKN